VPPRSPDTAGSCRPGMCQRRHRRLGRGRGGRTRETDLTDPAADVDDAALLIQTQGTRQGVRDFRRGPRSRPCSMGDCPRNSSGRPVRGLARLRIAVTLEGVSWTAEWKGCAPAVGCHESIGRLSRVYELAVALLAMSGQRGCGSAVPPVGGPVGRVAARDATAGCCGSSQAARRDASIPLLQGPVRVGGLGRRGG